MAGVSGKAEKWFNETRKHLKHSIKGRHVKNVKYEEGMEIHTCSYCPKAFSDTRCLVMHVLRRHSDNLLLLHKNVMNVKNSDNTNLVSTDIINCIEAEFSDLKSELYSVKEIVLEFLSSNSKSPELQPSPSTTPICKSRPLRKSSGAIQEVSAERESKLTQKLCDNSNCSSNLDSKIHSLFETYKKDAMLKDIKEEIAVNKKEIFQEVRSSLQPEFQSMLLHHIDKSSSELKKSVFELKRNLTQLTELVKSNTERLKSLEASPKAEERLEQQLQSILNSGSLYDDKKKTKSKTTPHTQRKKKSIFTITSQPSKTHNNSRPLLSESDVLNSEKNLFKRPEITDTSNSGPKIIEETKKSDLRDIKSIVDEKLRSYNINPSIEKLSSEEFIKKKHLLNTETEMLRNSVEGFAEVRDSLDSYVDKVARSCVKTKCPKKLRFSDSLKQPTPVLKSSEVSVLQNPDDEKETLSYMSPVELADDYLAQGDCNPLSNKMIANCERNKNSLKPDYDAELGLESGFPSNVLCTGETYRKARPKSTPKGVEFNSSISHKHPEMSFAGSSQNFEDLSELSSLSDLED